MSKEWEEWNRGGGPKYPNCLLVQYVFRNFGGNKEKNQAVKILDFGCGSGVNTLFFSENGFNTIACDISRTGIENAKKKLRENNLEADFIDTDLEQCDKETIDLFVCVQVLECVTKSIAEEIVTKMDSVLKIGGKFFFLFMSEGDFRENADVKVTLHGWKEIDVKEVFAKGNFTELFIDKSMVSFMGNSDKQMDWIVTGCK